MKKICLLVLFILACYPFILSVRNSQATDTQEGWKFRIVDDWGLWGNEVVKYDPVGGSFGAVAYLYNSTKPVRWTGEWSFENWFLIKSEEADTAGWVAFHELPAAWDNSAPNTEINYTLILKLKIGGDITPITIFNATILRVNYNGTDKRNLIGLKDLIQKSLVAHPSHRYPGRDWIQGITPSFIESGYACFKVWLYYVALQPLDELGFPITGTTLEVKYDSSPNGITYIGNQKVAGWKDKLYGKWITNGSLGSEFIFDTTYIYHANYKVGWVILRVPLINETTAGNSKYRSSLVSNLTFIWRFKSDTPINVTKYYEMKPINFVPPYPWGHLKSANPPTLGAYSSYLGLLMVNSSHRVNALVRWVMLNLTDCFGNNWWTVKAEAYAFDNAGKNHYMLAATRVGPGRYILRYPVPTYPFGNTTLTLEVEWYYGVVNVSRWKVGYTWPPHPSGYRIYDELNPAGWKSNIPSPYPRGILGVDNYWQQRSRRIRNNMTWVDVNFHSSTELPEELPDFVAKIWLPATIGYRKAENLTVRWNGRNGYVVLPDMEYYAGPNPATIPQLDPYSIAGLEGFDHFYEAMIQYFGTAGRFGGNGWLPTREVGWVDFEAWYEGTKVLDTYADGNSLKLECCEANPPDPTTCHYSFTLKIYEVGFHIILESCGTPIDQKLLTGIPFFFKHLSSGLSAYEMIGPKAVTNGKVEIVKAPGGNYSNLVIVWHMSLLKPYKILYCLDNGTTIELKEPILLDKNMRNIQLYFKLYNLTIDTWSQDPFRIVNVNVTLFSVSDFGIAPGVGISKRMIEQIIDKDSMYSKYVLPPGWSVFRIDVDQYGYPVIYYHTDTQTNKWNKHPSWNYLPEKDYWIWVRVPDTAQKAMNAGFRAMDANATLYWSGDPWNKPLHLDKCYGKDNPLILMTYVYNPKISLKTERGTPLVFDETNNSALTLAEPWGDGDPFYKQQINPLALVVIETPRGKMTAGYNAYFVRKNATDSSGVILLHSVNATDPDGKGTWSPKDHDLWNPTTGWVARKYPNQSRYLIGYSAGSGPIKEFKPKYRLVVYYNGILTYNESIVLSNPYLSKDNLILIHWQRWYNRTITIKADGTIDPRDAPIIRDGDTYSLTANVEVTSKEGIIVEKDNIIIDGNNHMLRGGGEYDENKYIWGILLIEKKNVTIKKMVIQGFKIGICLSDALNNIIIENNLTNNWCGIFLEESQKPHNNIMIANNIMNNEYGIYIEYSSNNRILENNIVNNTYGIFLYASSNEIYHNNFICNKRQADTSGAANIWNENYWNDYKGMDTDNDGFGNIPYVINENNRDEHPLMNPFKKYLASDYYFINVVTSYGTATGSGCYKPGATATISMSLTVIDHGNGTRHVFTGWYEKGQLITANQSFTITVTESRSIAAEWSTQYEIKTSTQYGDVNGSGWYKPGETVTISISSTQAERDFFTNVVFEGWEINGKVVSTSPTYYFTVDNPVTLVASWRTEVKPFAIGLISGIIILIIATRAVLIVKRKLKPSPPQPQPSPTPPTPIETEIEKEIRKLEEYLERLEQLRKEGQVSEQVYERLKQEYEKKLEELIEKLKK